MLKKVSGHATADATKAYSENKKEHTAKGHFSDFLDTGIKLSSIGIGTFSGDLSNTVDDQVANITFDGVQQGINIVDTAAHYRNGRSLVAVGAGLHAAFENGMSRDEIFVISKGGFITFRGGRPTNFSEWFSDEIESKKLGDRADLVNQIHLLSPEYINYQIDLSRNLMGLETLDAFLIDQPEIHIATIGKEQLNQKLLKVFVQLEKAVQANKIRCYGVSTFNGMRVETDDENFQSIASMQGLAEKAAKQVKADFTAKHHFKIIQAPFNIVMSEIFTRFNQATGQGNVAATLQTAYQLGVYMIASHSLMKGKLAQDQYNHLQMQLPAFENAAQRAIQFNRSTPGLGTSLVGMSQRIHLDDCLAVSQKCPLTKKFFLSLFEKNE